MEDGFWDISQPLHAALPAWPGDTRFNSETVWRIDADCPVNVARFGCSSHAGTHADAPLHYDPAGAPIDALSLAPFIGPARVIDLRGGGPVVTASMLQAVLEPSIRRLLLRTYDRFPHDAWQDDFTTIDADAIRLLAASGVVLVGIDSPSIDPREAKQLHAHDAARDADLRILEGLVLDDVAAGEYELIALPLRLRGLDASPVRAVLRSLG